jgi:hypothetical protein
MNLNPSDDLVMLCFWMLFWFVILGPVGWIARGKSSGFWWGALLGPLGVIVAAILRAGDKPAPQPAACAPVQPPAPARRVTLIRRPAPVEIVPCGHCAGRINVAGVSGRFACPHCQGSLEV